MARPQPPHPEPRWNAGSTLVSASVTARMSSKLLAHASARQASHNGSPGAWDKRRRTSSAVLIVASPVARLGGGTLDGLAHLFNLSDDTRRTVRVPIRATVYDKRDAERA